MIESRKRNSGEQEQERKIKIKNENLFENGMKQKNENVKVLNS